MGHRCTIPKRIHPEEALRGVKLFRNGGTLGLELLLELYVEVPAD
jgi:hypothetical protein